MATDESFENQFYSLIKFLGEDIANLTTQLGKWDDVEKDESATYIWYKKYYASFYINSKNDIVDCLTIPKADAYGHHYDGDKEFYLLNGVHLGMTKKEVLNQWGEPVGKAIRRWVYEKIEIPNGTYLTISVGFGEDTSHEFYVSEFCAEVVEIEEPVKHEQPFDVEFHSLIRFLGENIVTLTTQLGKWNDVEKDKYTTYLWYKNYYALFHINSQNNIVESFSIPKADAYGHHYDGDKEFYLLNGIHLGMTKKEVLNQWGEPVGKAINRWIYGKTKMPNGTYLTISIGFREDTNYEFYVSEFCAEVVEIEEPIKFEDQFLPLCKYLGSNEVTVNEYLGMPDSSQIDEDGKKYLYYERYKALFTIPRDFEVLEFVAIPNPNSKITDDFYTLFGLQIGASKNEILRIWGKPSGEETYVWAYGNKTGTTNNGYHFEIRLLFDTDNPNILGGFGGMLIDYGTPNITSNKPKSGCFVATACYGNYDAYEVLILRKFRDEILLKSIFGKAIVQFYYYLSPPFANFIEKSDALKSFIRKFILQPIVSKIQQNQTS